jgi:hypothetical protein
MLNSKIPAFVLYGARGSTNTDRVRLTLAEGGFTDYELVLADLQRGEQKVSSPAPHIYNHASFPQCQDRMKLTVIVSVRRKHETAPMGQGPSLDIPGRLHSP